MKKKNWYLIHKIMVKATVIINSNFDTSKINIIAISYLIRNEALD